MWARKNRTECQQDQDHYRPGAQPDAGHFDGHFETPLSEVTAQGEKAAVQQQAQGAGDKVAQHPESVATGFDVGGRDETLPQPEQRQCGQRDVDHPHSGGMRPLAVLTEALPPSEW